MSVREVRLTSKVMIKTFRFIIVGFSNSRCFTSENGMDVCFEEGHKGLDDILCHGLELIIITSEFFRKFFYVFLFSFAFGCWR